jgi:regulator of protease activity HflC (stomatin/prohibitin superfamily)
MNFSRIIISILLTVTIIVGALIGMPVYWVWSKEMNGKAQLKEAEYAKQILVEDAKARKLSAMEDAEAEVIRAQGMAQAMEIENGKLTPIYNQYLFIRTLEELSEQGNLPQLIYLPSEGMLPVLDISE